MSEQTPPTIPAAAEPVTSGRAPLRPGDVLTERTYRISRESLARYADASGDHNPIHRDDAVATSVGLDGVIAHGMLTMGTAISAVVDALGDPAAVREYSTRFTRPVPVPAEGTTELTVRATVGPVDEAAGTARIDLSVETGGAKVLGRARATVALPTAGEGA